VNREVDLPRDPKLVREFEAWQKPLPNIKAHGYPDEIRENLRPLKPKTWHLEGNKLIGETEMGPLVQFIPTNYILLKTDEDGLPVFKKIQS
jgi:hypothetical protein